MVKKELLVSPDLYDLEKPIARIEDIEKYNPQRFEMEQLTAIVYENAEDVTCVGYKDMTDEEFWIRGHIPGNPILPGVIICEAAAQLASYLSGKLAITEGTMMGFAGLDEVKFRGLIRPGDRLVIQAKMLKMRKFLITAQFMALVGDDIVAEGIIKGFPLSKELLEGQPQNKE
ncbi:MAG: beta-hydroxyacyl-ACP dehydratase [Thermoguttaceae bacterium]|nr:beta-hydroxyacyl-ACP dehydratase [Thermoguttaceae bacterium]MBR6480650.1 beta-hydroxyacyl-ACP dehydratase [Thermoguttaceae bacterium]